MKSMPLPGNFIYYFIFLINLLLQIKIIYIANANEVNSAVYDIPLPIAVQNKLYDYKHDLTAHIGYLPSDAFNKSILLGLSYTYYYPNYVGWEILNLNYAHNMETKLKKELISEFPLEIENAGFEGRLDYIVMTAVSSITYTPFYNKSVLFNDILVRGETGFIFGGGIAYFKKNGSRPLIGFGVILRYFFDDIYALKFDVRQNFYFEKGLGAVNMVSITGGFSWLFVPKNQGNEFE